MTVQELIEKLKEYPCDMEVFQGFYPPSSFCTKIHMVDFWEKLYCPQELSGVNLRKIIDGKEKVIKSQGVVLW